MLHVRIRAATDPVRRPFSESNPFDFIERKWEACGGMPATFSHGIGGKQQSVIVFRGRVRQSVADENIEVETAAPHLRPNPRYVHR
jgi:hypothetical protein